MKHRLASVAAVLAGACLLSACGTTSSRFEWGGYEGALYAYAKAPDKRPVYRTALESAIAKGRATNRVAPGLLAELGYLDLEDGDTKGAVALFEEEMRLFPESKSFLSAVVARAQSGSVPEAAKTGAVS
jgi:hypothetical protein